MGTHCSKSKSQDRVTQLEARVADLEAQVSALQVGVPSSLASLALWDPLTVSATDDEAQRQRAASLYHIDQFIAEMGITNFIERKLMRNALYIGMRATNKMFKLANLELMGHDLKMELVPEPIPA